MQYTAESALPDILGQLLNATDKKSNERKTVVKWFNRLYFEVDKWNASYIATLKSYPGFEHNSSIADYAKFLDLLGDYLVSLNTHYSKAKGDLCANLRILSKRFSKDFEWLSKENPSTYDIVLRLIDTSYSTEGNIITVAEKLCYQIKQNDANWHSVNANLVVKSITDYIDASRQDVARLRGYAEQAGIELLSISEYEEAINEASSPLRPNIMLIDKVDASQNSSVNISGNANGVVSGRDVTFGHVLGQVAIGENITQTQNLSKEDKSDLCESLVQFQKDAAKLNLPPDEAANVNSNINLAVREALKDQPDPVKIQGKLQGAIETIKEVGDTIETVSKWEWTKKILTILGRIGLKIIL
jgi:hypothetical protein